MMGAIPIPENTIGRVGMVAALKRVGESDIGKLVVLREPAGMVTSLVGSNKPVFAWLAQALGEPIDCHGKQSRSIYVADRCLIPISEMTDADVELISRSQAQADFDSALQEMNYLVAELRGIKTQVKPASYRRERRRHKAAIGLRAVTRWFPSVAAAFWHGVVGCAGCYVWRHPT